jgi:hypothetical protein
MKAIYVCLAVALAAFLYVNRAEAQTAATGEQPVNPSARKQVTHQEACPGVVSTAVSSVLVGRKSISFDNRSAATCYATMDGTAVTTAGAKGEKFAPGDYRAYDLGSGIPVRIACTAATTTPACIQISQYK